MTLQPTTVTTDQVTLLPYTVLDVKTGLQYLVHGDIILAKDYEWSANKDVYFRLNNGYTEIAYSVSGTSFDFWSQFNIPIHIFTIANCYLYDSHLSQVDYLPGITVTYTSPESNKEDSAIITNVYYDESTIYYQLSREDSLFTNGRK